MTQRLRDAASDVAREMLSETGDRWRHTQAVAARAEAIEGTVYPEDRDVLVAAAWLHDVGYAPPLVETGFHPLDGARYLATRGFDERLCALVAQHSGARFEAAERGLSDQLAPYGLEDSPVMDALVVADFTTGPQGQPLTYEARIAEILRRYPSDSAVHRAISIASEELSVHLERVERRLLAAYPDVRG